MFGYVSISLWLNLVRNGILWAYLRLTDASTPKVEATALHPPSIASFTIFSGSKYIGFGANDAPAECSMPWSTGRIERYPLPARRPLSKSDWSERKVAGERSEWVHTRSMKSGPGRLIRSLGIPSDL